MWEQVLYAYADRSRIVPDADQPFVIRRNGDVLPTILVNGQVAGVWRVVDGTVEITAFHDLSAATWRNLAEEARRLGTFVAGRDLHIYRRYHHWWDDLPLAKRSRGDHRHRRTIERATTGDARSRQGALV